MDIDAKRRTRWLALYIKSHSAAMVCRRCGISAPTLRKWVRRYISGGLMALESRTHRPIHSPGRKLRSREVRVIDELRRSRNIGARRLQNDLRSEFNLSLSLASIHKTLKGLNAQPLDKTLRKPHCHRYERPIPGDRVQMDTMKVVPGIYQFTAIDDCSRYKVIGIYPRRSAECTLQFIDDLLYEMPFPIQTIQTDRGREFFALSVQQRLMEIGIKFRPIRPRSPHLNGKVERTQKTDLQEFYPRVDIHDPNLFNLAKEWQHQFNWFRAHGGLKGLTPIQRLVQLSDKTPTWEEIEPYDPTKEHVQLADYRAEMAIRKLNRSL
jgi:transposase InsO family protein